MTKTLAEFVVALGKYAPARGVNQYASVRARVELLEHLSRRRFRTLVVGESPATLCSVAFGDSTRSSQAMKEAGEPRWAHWNAWPMVLPTKTKPNALELLQSAEWLRALIASLRPGRVVAVGRVAEKVCELAGVDCLYVPHPGQDKLKQFREQMEEVKHDVVLTQNIED